ncbi:MAG: hypothetical protein AAB638_01580, partial [Patescibacteria group bacterium]
EIGRLYIKEKPVSELKLGLPVRDGWGLFFNPLPQPFFESCNGRDTIDEDGLVSFCANENPPFFRRGCF